jgi:hypothetical protein
VAQAGEPAGQLSLFPRPAEVEPLRGELSNVPSAGSSTG